MTVHSVAILERQERREGKLATSDEEWTDCVIPWRGKRGAVKPPSYINKVFFQAVPSRRQWDRLPAATPSRYSTVMPSTA
jgi:hypothetical protein